MDYARLKSRADAMLDRFQQGTIEIASLSKSSGATPLDPPTVTATWQEYSGAARGVSQKYIDGETILATDLMAIMQADMPASVGSLARIDGVDRQIVRVDHIPAAGTVVAKRVFFR